jgi:hypothetical protein
VVAVVVMAKARDWPAELRKPITMKQLRTGHSEFATSDNELTDEEIKERYVAECLRRIAAISGFFKVSKSQAGDVLLVMKLCRHWGIPGFDIEEEPRRGPGAPRIWTPEKQCEIFADVMSLVDRSRISEHSACQALTRRHTSRYEGVSPKTLHREFLRAKKKIVDDPLFRTAYFSEDELRENDTPTYGPELIKRAIQRYAIAQQSKPNNIA